MSGRVEYLLKHRDFPFASDAAFLMDASQAHPAYSEICPVRISRHFDSNEKVRAKQYHNQIAGQQGNSTIEKAHLKINTASAIHRGPIMRLAIKKNPYYIAAK